VQTAFKAFTVLILKGASAKHWIYGCALSPQLKPTGLCGWRALKV